MINKKRRIIKSAELSWKFPRFFISFIGFKYKHNGKLGACSKMTVVLNYEQLDCSPNWSLCHP